MKSEEEIIEAMEKCRQVRKKPTTSESCPLFDSPICYECTFGASMEFVLKNVPNNLKEKEKL